MLSAWLLAPGLLTVMLKCVVVTQQHCCSNTPHAWGERRDNSSTSYSKKNMGLHQQVLVYTYSLKKRTGCRLECEKSPLQSWKDYLQSHSKLRRATISKYQRVKLYLQNYQIYSLSVELINSCTALKTL